MLKHTYYIKGMHCASCELLIEKRILELKGAVFADASLAKSRVEVEFSNEKPPVEELNKIFAKSGYVFSNSAFEKNKGEKDFLGPMVIALLVIAAFLGIAKLGFSSFIGVSSNSSLAAFFIFGVIAGVSSCAALIGGLVLSLSKQWLESFGGGNWEKTKPHFLFNLGRIISFAMLGALLGFLGEKFRISPSITSVLILFVSGMMILLALQMLGVKSLQKFRVALPKSFSGFIFKNEQSEKKWAPMLIGFLTFLLPCGFTIAAEGAAVLSASPLEGSLIMLLFASGTAVPLLFIGFSSSKLISSRNLSEKFIKVAGALIIFFVAYNLNFQFGITRYFSENWKSDSGANISVSPSGTPSKDVQLLESVYTKFQDMQPGDFEVKKGKPVRMEIKVQDTAYGCMSTVMIPGLWNKPLRLIKGKTIIMEFTPQKTGSYQITCAMGVPRGSLNVIN